MPELDGYEVLAELKDDPHLRDIPVIVTSALDELDSVVRCLEMGAEDYLTKPVNPVLLNARINASLEKKRLRDQQRELISKFATKEVADDLLTSGFSLGGQYVDASAMFCDIRSFTTISESREPGRDDRAAQRLLPADDGRDRRRGRDRQPDGRRRPDGDLRRARAARGPPAGGRARGAADGRADPAVQRGAGGARTRCRSRSASGSRRAGSSRATPGRSNRATYTCVGDTVNVAARLEAHTKELGRPILIDENTRQRPRRRNRGRAAGRAADEGKDRADEGVRRPRRRARRRDGVARNLQPAARV